MVIALREKGAFYLSSATIHVLYCAVPSCPIPDGEGIEDQKLSEKGENDAPFSFYCAEA